MNDMDTPPIQDSILIVDDDWMNREVLEAYLEADNRRIMLASNGEKAIELATTQQPTIIILDVKMPGLSGLEACQKLKSTPATAHIPIAMITGLESDEDIRQVIEAGADDFLTKPFNPLLLQIRIRLLLKIAHLQKRLQS